MAKDDLLYSCVEKFFKPNFIFDFFLEGKVNSASANCLVKNGNDNVVTIFNKLLMKTYKTVIVAKLKLFTTRIW